MEKEKLREKVIQEQIARDPVIPYVETLKEEVSNIEDPLSKITVESQPSDWSNIPQVVARYIISQNAHFNRLVEFLTEKMKEETTAHLRASIEQKMLE